MKQAVVGGIVLLYCTAWASAQSPDTPLKFEIADVHASVKTSNPNQFVRLGPARGGRYEIKTATIVDLVRFAYGFDADKILGGPSWLEMDRFDVTAKVPTESSPDDQKLMLQSLLAERFHLVVHKDTRPLPAYALIVGKKLQIKESDGAGDSGCKPQTGSGSPEPGGVRMMTSNANGTTTTINLGPGMTIQYTCRNMTMAAFVAGLRGMMGTSIGANPVTDETGLEGKYTFDLKYSLQLMGPMISNTADRISIFDAVEKQLGLKLEQRQVPTPVIVVDSVNRKPTDNPPGVAEALPPLPVPTEFEVASIKPADPDARMSRFQMQPGGRLIAENMPLRFLISRAFNTNSNDQIVGVPKFADSDRYDITAKAPAGGPSMNGLDNDLIAPMVRALLVDRFKLTYHTEDREVPGYALVAGKSKMKKADPESRTSCKNGNAPVGAPPGSRVLTCQNITMAQFAERLQGSAPELGLPVADSTGLEGTWDFTLTYSFGAMMAMNAGPRGGDAAAAGVPSAADPTGGQTIFEAIEKQLGLKLEKQKRTMPVIVIDHMEQKPTEN
jgi:uncharacterized protein (TIGR03435 family)